MQLRLETVLQVVDIQVVVAMKTDQIVLITFVVAKKEILAVHAPIVVPPLFGFFDGLTFRMCIAGERNIVLCKPLKNKVCTRTNSRKLHKVYGYYYVAKIGIFPNMCKHYYIKILYAHLLLVSVASFHNVFS